MNNYILILDEGVRNVGSNKKVALLSKLNEMDVQALPDTEVIIQYKNQQKVEKGFRFLSVLCF